MRVALTVTRSDVFGGAVVHVRDLCVGLRALDHEAVVFIGGHGVFADHLRQQGVPVRCVPHLGREIRPWADVLALRELVRGLAEFKPEVIHGHTGKAGWLTRVAATLLRTPFVYSPHCWPFLDNQSGRRRHLYLLAERVIGRLPGTTVNVCDFEQQVALSAGVGRPDSHVVVHNGVVDVGEAFLARPSAQPPHVVVVARFEPQKDYASVISALSRLTDVAWRATFIGDGPQRPACLDQLRACGLEGRVALPGEVDDVERWLSDAQIFVLMSNWEGLPLTVLEAMRAGLPVVASRTGGVAEAVADGESGLLVDGGDVDGLERSLRSLLEDPAARERMGRAGRERYLARFTIDRMIGTLESLYLVAAVPGTAGPTTGALTASDDGSSVSRSGRRRSLASGAPAITAAPATGRLARAAATRLSRARRTTRMLTSEMRAKPDFLVIGTQRGGTTSLYRYLSEHPFVRPAQSKEVHYFDAHYELGDAWYRSHFPLSRLTNRRATSASRSVTGEATPYYLFHPHAPARVAAMLPGVKIIALLRDPVQRAYSHYHHERAKGREPLSFEQAVAQEPGRLDGELERMISDASYDSARLRHYSYVARGRYADQLARWYSAFPAERVLLLKSEDLYSDPAATVDRVDRFLGLPPRPASLYRRHNAREYEGLPPGMADDLRELFRLDNQRLYQMVGRDFGWDG